MTRHWCIFILSFLGISAFSQQKAALELPLMFSDYMILQQKASLPVWGWASPNAAVHVTLGSHMERTVADEKGKWRVNMPPMDAGGPFEMTVWTVRDTIRIKDILVGEVFLASGQSNMEYPMKEGIGPRTAEEIAAANYPEIRFFQVEHNPMSVPQEQVRSRKWRHCTPTVVPYVSAVAYFFARQVHLDQKVPVGVISSTWGGTPIEAWISPEKLAEDPDFTAEIASFDKDTATWNAKASMYRRSNQYRDSLIANSSVGLQTGVNLPYYIDRDWNECQYPIVAAKLKLSPQGGFVWFRKSFTITRVEEIKDYYIDMLVYGVGSKLFINGQPVQTIKPEGREEPVAYIHGSQLIFGENIFSVRLLYWTDGGIGIRSKPGRLISTDSTISLNMEGTWKYNGDIEPRIPVKYDYYKSPNVLYNGMIAPLIPYAIKGVIWYQGESNVKRAYKYRSLFPMLIEDWRARWGEGNFPFMYVQLANYMEKKAEPGDDDWAELREAQLMTLKVPNTAMAVAIDLGEAKDIHPKNKYDVARRLFLCAEHLIYGKKVVYSGPIFKSVKFRDGKAYLTFNHVGSGLTTKKGQPLKGFSVAGKDKKFHWAEAVLSGNEVMVSYRGEKYPVAVRYSWEINPDGNLYNLEGLPASPFRSDDWKLSTEP